MFQYNIWHIDHTKDLLQDRKNLHIYQLQKLDSC